MGQIRENNCTVLENKLMTELLKIRYGAPETEKKALIRSLQ